MKKNNPYLTLSGVLSILLAIAYLVAAGVTFFMLLFCYGIIKAIQSGTEDNSSAIVPALLILLIVFVIGFAVCIFLACQFLKNRNKFHEELRQKKALFIASIVLAFVFGIVFVGIFALLGYLEEEQKVDAFLNGPESIGK